MAISPWRARPPRASSLDRVLFVPAAHPPHKAGVTHAPYADRVRMAELACQGDPRFEVSRLEEGTARSYSIDTIEKLRARLAPGDQLYFLIGADAFAEIRTWHRWRDVARGVRFLVVSRPGHLYQSPPGVEFDRIDDIEVPISSSDIRRALASGQSPCRASRRGPELCRVARPVRRLKSWPRVTAAVSLCTGRGRIKVA